MTPLLEVRHLTIEFPGSDRADGGTESAGLAAVRDLSFTIAPGEALGLVGESGSGKSVTSLAIMRLLVQEARTSGQVLLKGDQGAVLDLLKIPQSEVQRIRGSRITMIFQEPMTALNPVMRVGDQIAEAMRAHHRVSRRDAGKAAIRAMEDVAIPDAANRARDYPHQLSGGMRQRVMIAMALVNRPELVIADEPTTALDVTIQAQILELLSVLRAKYGLTMLFISHDLAVVSEVADRVAVMYAGSLVELGDKREIFTAPAHPYTRGLLHAVPTLRTSRDQPLETIEGTVPALHAMPRGCAFEPRCQWRQMECRAQMPPLVEVAPRHWARCPVVNTPRPMVVGRRPSDPIT